MTKTTTPAPAVQATPVETEQAEKKQPKTVWLESKYLEHQVYSRDSEKLLARFHRGRAEVTQKQLEDLKEHPEFGKTFGYVGAIKGAAQDRMVEVQVR